MEVAEASRPYARGTITFNVVGIALLYLVYGATRLHWLRVPFSLGLPALLSIGLYLVLRLYRAGRYRLPIALFLVSAAFIVLGAAFDMIVTVNKTPDLAEECNVVVRSLLDAGFPLWSVYTYSILTQILLQAFLCAFFAAFLRHRTNIIEVVASSHAVSILAFIKAALGWGHAPLKQAPYAFKRSFLPDPYCVVWFLLAFWATQAVDRWCAGLQWLEVLPNSNGFISLVFWVSLIIYLFSYLAWLRVSTISSSALEAV